MSTTEPETTIVGEIVEPLSKPQAKALDKRIRSASDKVASNFNLLLDLLEEAARGQIHRSLGASSWTAYVKDAVQINISDRIERKSLVSLMSGKGMSQPAIAALKLVIYE
jgi:hypothetical protein